MTKLEFMGTNHSNKKRENHTIVKIEKKNYVKIENNYD